MNDLCHAPAVPSGYVERVAGNTASARELSGDNWDDTDQALLQTYLDGQ